MEALILDTSQTVQYVNNEVLNIPALVMLEKRSRIH